MNWMLASAAAQQTGLPPKVERWSPGLYAAAISGLAVNALSGKPSAIPFAVTRMTGSAINPATSFDVANFTMSSIARAHWRAHSSGSLGQSERYAYGAGAKEIPAA